MRCCVTENTFDVVVIGAGPGGYVASIRAAQLGMKVACVEAGELGGVCNNSGCIPTKALLESAAMAQRLGQMKDYGIQVGKVDLDLGVAVRRSRKIAAQGARGIGFLFKKNGVSLFQGRGRLAGDGKVVVQGAEGSRELAAKHIILATGSRPQELPMLKPDGDRIWNSSHALVQERPPASLVVVGAGAIGMEFADIFASFGTQVTVIEAMPHVLPLEDVEVAEVVARAFRKRGIKLLAGAMVKEADLAGEGVRLDVEIAAGKNEVVEAERVLVAVGRQPVLTGLGLEEAGVEVKDGFIAVDDRLATNVPGVYAIGDVARPPLLAHKASHEGVAAVGSIVGDELAGVDLDNIPNVTYCHPEVASVGLTEAAAEAQGLEFEVGKAPFMANGRARAAGVVEGFVKIIRDVEYDAVLGAHIVGPNASELIGEFVMARYLEGTVDDVERVMHPHPTLSENIGEAALAAFGRAIHM